MSQSAQGLAPSGRAALHDLVTKRLELQRSTGDIDAEISCPFAHATDFSTLPGVEELKLGRSAIELLGLPNPYFRVHEGRAGATTQIAGRCLLNFSSYDYLGLNGHAEVEASAKAATETYGTSCSASRLVAGERPLHDQLERALAAHYRQDASLVFVSGHATNLAVIAALLGPKDLIIHDAYAHNSVVMGSVLSGATRRTFPHNDAVALDRILASCRAQYERVLIVAEGLYSMHGDCCDLPMLIEIKRRHGAWLMIDDAHGLGVLGATGKGVFEHFSVDPRGVDVWMGTLSKTLASCGGYIAGNGILIEYLKFMAGGFVYSVGLPPPMTAAALAALEILAREPDRVRRLQRNAALFWTRAKDCGLDLGSSAGHAIVPVLAQSSLGAGLLSQHLFERGVNVQPIVHPAVPERHARLRFFLSCDHSSDQIVEAVGLVSDCMRQGAAASAPHGPADVTSHV